MRRLSNNTNLVNKLKRSIIFGLVLYVVITPAWAGIVQISKINGDHSKFEIKRGEENIQKFSPFDSLQTGDKICVFKPEKGKDDPHNNQVDGKPYSITLLWADSHSETLSYENYPCPKYFEVDQADVPTGGGGVWGALVAFLTDPWKKDIDDKWATTKGPDKEPLVIPANVNPKLIEGRSVLYLGMQGNSTFSHATVRLLQQGGKEVPTESESSSPGVIKLGEKLTVGQQYTVVVCDNTVSCKDCYSDKLVPGKQTGTFIVMSPPTLPTEDVEKQLSEVSRKTLKAFQLFNLDKQQWSFEVYQQVRDILANSCSGEDDPKCYSAYLIKQTIEGGEKK